MWIEHINNTNFIIQLFDKIPELVDVVIEQFNVNYYGRGIKIIIILPQFIDNVPLKWKQKNYNAAVVEIDFGDISQFMMTMDDKKRSNIRIEDKGYGKIGIEINGGINASFMAEVGYIQNVNGYIIENPV